MEMKLAEEEGDKAKQLQILLDYANAKSCANDLLHKDYEKMIERIAMENIQLNDGIKAEQKDIQMPESVMALHGGPSAPSNPI